MFDLFKRLRHLENAVQNLDIQLAQSKVELESLKDALDDARAERNEFKELLFRNSGLKRDEILVQKDNIEPIRRRTGVNRVISDLEIKSREKAWEEKAREADKILNNMTEKKENE